MKILVYDDYQKKRMIELKNPNATIHDLQVAIEDKFKVKVENQNLFLENESILYKP